MQPSTKRFLKKIFPLGFLVFAHRLKERIVNKFRYPVFLNHWKAFTTAAKAAGDTRFELSPKYFSPILHEMANLQHFDRHYTYHPAWAARKVAQTKPAKHIDISSTLNFCAIVSAFTPVEFYDYRPADLSLSNLTMGSADLLQLHFATNSIASLSCMHTVEHIGLGRYGDPIDPMGDLKAMSELSRVLAVGGNLFFVVPVGRPQLMFNAQRIYAYEQIMHGFRNLKLVEFTLLPDEGGLVTGATAEQVSQQAYGCGLFWFTKAA